MTKIELQPFAHPFSGAVQVPGSKSITNRILPLAALSGERISIFNALRSEDTLAMIEALRQFGVEIQAAFSSGANFSQLIVTGNTGVFPQTGAITLDCKNSGTTLRFLTALSALRAGETILTGSVRMQERPIADLVTALRTLGIRIEYLGKEGFPPLKVVGSGEFSGGATQVGGAISSQFLSALLLLSPFARQKFEIELPQELVSRPYFTMTVQLLKQLGVAAEEFTVAANSTLAFPQNKFTVEADATAATYPLAIALITGGTITVQNFSSNSLQGDSAFATRVLAWMGAEISEDSNGLTLQAPKELQPLGEINLEDMPDAAMTAVVLAAYASGRSRITGLKTLKDKESDRLQALSSNLQKMGAEVQVGADFIETFGAPEKLHGAEIETFHDHRIAMCFAVLGAVVPGVVILNPDCVEKTYPTYWTEYEEWRNRR